MTHITFMIRGLWGPSNFSLNQKRTTSEKFIQVKSPNAPYKNSVFFQQEKNIV